MLSNNILLNDNLLLSCGERLLVQKHKPATIFKFDNSKERDKIN